MVWDASGIDSLLNLTLDARLVVSSPFGTGI